MELIIRYELSQQGQKASLQLGGDGKRNQCVAGEISPEELSHPLISVVHDGSLQSISLENCNVTLYAAGWKRPEWSYVKTDPFDAPLDFGSAWELAKKFKVQIEAEKARLQPECEAALAAHKEREVQEKAKQIAQRDSDRKYEEGRTARKEAAENALRQWGQDQGSALLQARIADGFEWKSLARREYANMVLASAGLPSGHPWGDGCGDRERPTLEEIQTLRKYREALGDRAQVALAWLTTDTDYDDDPVRPWSESQAALAVDISAPDGNTVNRVIPWSELPQ